ncbi:MAG: hypothetical protein RML45_04145 [Acetobacteraceae bacterium]|nr:hypothetical protein [Acetobacteraceae bacterium]
MRVVGLMALVVGGAVLGGCASFIGSGEGFGGFGASSRPTLAPDGYTGRRLVGQDDGVAPLVADTAVAWPRLTLERPPRFETEEERTLRERRERLPRGASTRPGPETITGADPADLQARVPPREPPSPPVDRRGQPIPATQPGTVTTGGTGRLGTFGGPAGSGTTLQEGGMMTLMGADGRIRTVPAPR